MGQYTPRRVMDVRQGDSATYAQNQITLHWEAPEDDGCLPIENYLIEAEIASVWTQVGSSTTTTGVADLSAQMGQLTKLRVTGVNDIGEG